MRMADSMGEEDWDSEIEIEEVGEDNINDVQITKENETVSDVNANVMSKGESQVKEHLPEETDEEIVIEEINDGHKKKSKRLRCKVCFLKIVPNKFPEHLERVHGMNPETVKETCRHCKEKVFSLRLHRPVCSEATKHCPRCDKRFCLLESLNDHIRFCHSAEVGSPNFKCHLCSSNFSTANNMRRHLLVHDASNYQTCQYCTRKIIKRSILAHEQMCKEIQEKIKFNRQQREEICHKKRAKHQESMTKKKCQYCCKMLTAKYIQKHEESCPKSKQIKDAHNTEVKSQRCSYCEKRFHPGLGLKDHEESCRKRKPEARRSGGGDSGKGEDIVFEEDEEEQGSRCDYCAKEIKGEDGMEEHKVMCWEEVYGRRGVDKEANQVMHKVVMGTDGN